MLLPKLQNCLMPEGGRGRKGDGEVNRGFLPSLLLATLRLPVKVEKNKNSKNINILSGLEKSKGYLILSFEYG